MKGMLALLAAGAVLGMPLRAADPAVSSSSNGPRLSGDRLELLNQRGYFTPAFKDAVRRLVQARQAVAQARAQETALKRALPGLQQHAADLQTQLAALQKELDVYAHPEDGDYDALQTALKNPATPPEQVLQLAQAFVWSYPTDPRQPEAEQDLVQVQKQMADRRQAELKAAAAAAAARARLEQRARARQLSLAEWRSFLRDMSQEQLVGYLGRPQTEGEDYWTYEGAWTSDPVTHEKIGLQVHFNGTRVIDVTPAPAGP